MTKRYKKVYIEISNICNLQCSFCPEVFREKKIMSPEMFRNILIQVLPLTDQVCLHLMGEPMAHPQFEEILNICESKQAKINLTSNGILLNRMRSFLLGSKCIRQINFSLHSFRDNFPEKSMDDYLHEIFSFSMDLMEINPEIYINYRLWNQKEISIINTTNEEVINKIEKYFAVLFNTHLALDWKKSKRITKRLNLHFDTEFEWPSLQKKFRSKKGFCHGLSSHFGIHADGTVVPCCLDKEAGVNLGNCSKEEKSLQNILASARVNEIFQGFKNFQLVEDLCQKCTYIERFDGKLPVFQFFNEKSSAL